MLKGSIKLNTAWISASTCDFSYVQDYLHAQAFCTIIVLALQRIAYFQKTVLKLINTPFHCCHFSVSFTETSFPVKEENAYQNHRLQETTCMKLCIQEHLKSDKNMIQSVHITVQKHWAKEKQHMLSTCERRMGFRDISNLHSKTYLFCYFLEIRRPSVRSLQEQQRKYLPYLLFDIL